MVWLKELEGSGGVKLRGKVLALQPVTVNKITSGISIILPHYHYHTVNNEPCSAAGKKFLIKSSVPSSILRPSPPQ
jgi:hypothetical protein